MNQAVPHYQFLDSTRHRLRAKAETPLKAALTERTLNIQLLFWTTGCSTSPTPILGSRKPEVQRLPSNTANPSLILFKPLATAAYDDADDGEPLFLWSL